MERQTELDSFRQQWRNEVSAKNQVTRVITGGAIPQPSATGPGRPVRKRVPGPQPILGLQHTQTELDGYERYSFEHLEDKDDNLKLGNAGVRYITRDSKSEPQSALEHYEKAVERENQGSLGDSVSLYRKAFKLDSRVQEQYKKKHFPPSSSTPKPSNPNPSNTAVTVPGTAHHSLDGPLPSFSELIDQFSKLSIPPAPPETNLSPAPPCPIASIPEEVLVEILLAIATSDIATFALAAQVCKRVAYLTVTEERIWRTTALGKKFGFAAMHYCYACDIQGYPLFDPVLSKTTDISPIQLRFHDLTPSVYPTYRAQFRTRPRIRFNGCYISTVNYTRPGAASQTQQYTWSSPIHVVTYFRYLRFFRDGTVISLLSTAEPADVVHHLSKDNIHNHHGSVLPTVVMKDALRGRWRLSGSAGQKDLEPRSLNQNEESPGPGEYIKEPSNEFEGSIEEEGDVHIETEGVVPKYMWKMQFAMGSSGRKEGTRNNKLSWKGFWSYNRLTDDWGEFALKNDKPYYWSRVRSYGMGL